MSEPKTLNTEKYTKRRLLEKILDDIRNGTANLQDYKDYENILVSSGVSKEQIWESLNKNDINGWEAYIKKRSKASNYKELKETDAIIAGALVGLGLFALLLLLDD